jgi:hypothetical protein
MMEARQNGELAEVGSGAEQPMSAQMPASEKSDWYKGSREQCLQQGSQKEHGSAAWAGRTIASVQKVSGVVLPAAQCTHPQPTKAQTRRVDWLLYLRLVAPHQARIIESQPVEQIAVFASCQTQRGVEGSNVVAQ